jgi:hypothetical protein
MNIIGMINKKYWFGMACSMDGGKRNSCRILVEKQEGKRPLGRPRLRWDGNMVAKMNPCR